MPIIVFCPNNTESVMLIENELCCVRFHPLHIDQFLTFELQKAKFIIGNIG